MMAVEWYIWIGDKNKEKLVIEMKSDLLYLPMKGDLLYLPIDPLLLKKIFFEQHFFK